jgi:hypothetical protein
LTTACAQAPPAWNRHPRDGEDPIFFRDLSDFSGSKVKPGMTVGEDWCLWKPRFQTVFSSTLS